MQPTVKPLPYWRRKLVFILLLAIFILSLPVFMFYATGYRYDFLSDEPTITATGGLYISGNEADGAIYVDEVEVEDPRIFRKAAYIRGLEPNLHRVHIQAEGLNTWVKDLMVYPQIVTEVEVFHLPVVPQVRLVTEYRTADFEPVFFAKGLESDFSINASTTFSVFVTNKAATSTYKVDSEFILLTELFTEKASTTLLINKREKEIEKNRFSFATTTLGKVDTDQATTTIMKDNLMLYKKEEDVYVHALGTGKQIPYYFCSAQVATDTVSFEESDAKNVNNNELLFPNEMNPVNTECRTDIRIDRKWQTVKDFTFFPDNNNLVLMNLDDGVYVVEVDDRSWQNVQLLYPGKDLVMLVHGGSIFIKDGDLILEALTELISN